MAHLEIEYRWSSGKIKSVRLESFVQLRSIASRARVGTWSKITLDFLCETMSGVSREKQTKQKKTGKKMRLVIIGFEPVNVNQSLSHE